MMPRFLVETLAREATGHNPLDLPTGRFPEVEIERVYRTRDGGGERVVVVCRAPSEAHVRRWLDAAHIAIDAVRRIDGEEHPTTTRPAPPIVPEENIR